MKKIIAVKHEKIWGYELWLYSPLKEAPTFYEGTNQVVKDGPLIKIIKANDPLSIQVHPDDLLAKKFENQKNGKSECWVILETQKDSELIVGLKNHDKNYIKELLLENKIEDNLKIINPKIGEFINIEAGLVHGIGTTKKACITVLEVQQPSDITYRFWDYNRKDDKGNKRELHTNKALECIKDLDYKVKPIIKGESLIYLTQFYKIWLMQDTNFAPENGIAIVYDNNEYFAIELIKGQKINHKAIAFVSQRKK
ncbi:class I mannose-6-phosphate isomerase [Mycoplasmopsis alligatoris]|uniref:Conserved domain protein n=1 Tax=Mycoplasmopsis alligatoris A21JP2 TaxID=747682 RepID=D4XVD7_9BACT|nr:class I mannose-6-phosphate isomerase [Mycoplasmopsis alligatoris]EFF41585.1 conserved domain protein [Mycoplasmopsis alligatoris A21JP2]